MRIGPDDKLWIVTDSGPESTEGDILFEASLRELATQLKGGLTMDEHPTLFTDKREAQLEAYGRLTAMRASQVIARGVVGGDSKYVSRVEIYGKDGQLVFEADLPEPRS